MKNTIERIQDSIGNIKTAINEKYQNNGEEVPIGDDTLLEDYAAAIAAIKTETIDVSQQIFVFYCGATNEVDATENKAYPKITGNQEEHKGIIETTPGGGDISTNESELTEGDAQERYLYAMFVSVNTNTRNISGPNPVRLTGEKGEKGEDGSDGRDGVIAGLTLRNIITLYCASNTEPEIQHINYEQGIDLSQLIPGNIKINGAYISSSPTSYTNQQGSQTYDIKSDLPIKIGKIDILYSSKSEAMLLGNRPILITNVIDVEIKYGTSISPEISPDTWSDEYPANPNNTVGMQRKEKLSDHTVETIEYPIGLRGPAGIQFIANVDSENDLSSISPNYDNDYIGKLGVRVGQDVYVGYGTSDPYLTDSKKIGSNYGLNVGPLSPIPDGNAKEGEDGYIENRTHYEEFITQTYAGNFTGSLTDGFFIFDVPDGYKTKSLTISIPNTSVENVTLLCSETQNYIEITALDPNSNLASGRLFYQSGEIRLNVGGSPLLVSPPTFEMTVLYNKIVPLDPKFAPRMIEISYADLKNLRDTNQLIPGMQYRITDYETIVSGFLRGAADMVRSAGYQFDIIVTADDVNVLNENARAIQHTTEENDYFHNSNLAAWELKYCLDNDTNRFAWADDSDSGRGVIYYMKDEFNNECPYDFKNIQFKHPIYKSDSSIFWFTFTHTDSDFTYIEDITISGRAFNNIIKPVVFSNIVEINSNLLLSSMDNLISGNIFETDCYNNVVVNPVVHHIFDAGCFSNMIKNDGKYLGTPSYHFLSFVNYFTIDAVEIGPRAQYREIVVGNATVSGVAYGNIIDLF